MLQVINSGQLSATEAMEKDAKLLESLKECTSPILHLYQWSYPCITYGYFLQPSDYLHLEALDRHQIELVKRPTGGGVIFHFSDLAFSFLIPSTHLSFLHHCVHSYQWVNKIVAEAIFEYSQGKIKPSLAIATENFTLDKKPNFCMAQATPFDILNEDLLKIGGAAQRRKRWGILHQGSIFLAAQAEAVLKRLIKNDSLLEAVLRTSSSIMQHSLEKEELKAARSRMEELLTTSFEKSIHLVNSV